MHQDPSHNPQKLPQPRISDNPLVEAAIRRHMQQQAGREMLDVFESEILEIQGRPGNVARARSTISAGDVTTFTNLIGGLGFQTGEAAPLGDRFTYWIKEGGNVIAGNCVLAPPDRAALAVNGDLPGWKNPNDTLILTVAMNRGVTEVPGFEGKFQSVGQQRALFDLSSSGVVLLDDQLREYRPTVTGAGNLLFSVPSGGQYHYEILPALDQLSFFHISDEMNYLARTNAQHITRCSRPISAEELAVVTRLLQTISAISPNQDAALPDRHASFTREDSSVFVRGYFFHPAQRSMYGRAFPEWKNLDESLLFILAYDKRQKIPLTFQNAQIQIADESGHRVDPSLTKFSNLCFSLRGDRATHSRGY